MEPTVAKDIARLLNAAETYASVGRVRTMMGHADKAKAAYEAADACLDEIYALRELAPSLTLADLALPLADS